MRVINNGLIHSEYTNEWSLIVTAFAIKILGSTTRAENKA